MKFVHRLAALALLAMPAVAFAQDCTPLTAVPVTITQPGKYCLAKDFTINSATARAVTIASNDVTLDCQGRTLKNLATNNNGTSSAIFVNNRNNVVVENCRVIGGFQNGIDVYQMNTQANRNYYVQLRNNYIAGPFWHGIRAYGSALEVTGNKVYDVGGQLNQYAIGIRLGGSTVAGNFRQHVVRDNVVIGTSSPYAAAFGIFSDGSLASAYLDNGVEGTAGKAGALAVGIYVIGTFNRISDNHVQGVGAADEMGVWTTDVTSSCFDNYLRGNGFATQNCDATLGNY